VLQSAALTVFLAWSAALAGPAIVKAILAMLAFVILLGGLLPDAGEGGRGR
jgi:hypothetical protein